MDGSNEVIVAEKSNEAPLINGSSKLECDELINKKNEDEDGDLVTPWDVTASSKEGIDYDKLIGW